MHVCTYAQDGIAIATFHFSMMHTWQQQNLKLLEQTKAAYIYTLYIPTHTQWQLQADIQYRQEHKHESHMTAQACKQDTQ